MSRRDGAAVLAELRGHWFALIAVRVPVGNRTGLTSRQLEVAGLAAGGLSNDDIAARLGISRNTVRTHMHAARTRLAADSRAAFLRSLAAEAPLDFFFDLFLQGAAFTSSPATPKPGGNDQAAQDEE